MKYLKKYKLFESDEDDDIEKYLEPDPHKDLIHYVISSKGLTDKVNDILADLADDGYVFVVQSDASAKSKIKNFKVLIQIDEDKDEDDEFSWDSDPILFSWNDIDGSVRELVSQFYEFKNFEINISYNVNTDKEFKNEYPKSSDLKDIITAEIKFTK